MQFDFKQLPLSYRICQGAVATAIVMLLVFRHVNTPATPVILKTIFFSVFALIISTAVLFSSYVILRYPYLSLVQLNDGDFFDQYFTEGATWVRTLVKVTGLCLCLMFGCLVWFSGPDSLLGYGIVIYLSLIHICITCTRLGFMNDWLHFLSAKAFGFLSNGDKVKLF